MRIQIGHKFILGFIVVVAAVVLVPYAVVALDLPEWARGIIPTLAAMIIGLSIGSLITRQLTGGMGVLGTTTRAIAEGDLRQAVTLGRRVFTDEVDDLAASVNGMLSNLRQMVAHILRTSSEVAASAQNLSATAEEINASSEEISVTMEEVARGVEQQKGSVERMAELTRQLGEGLEEISRTCREASGSAHQAEEKALGGHRTAGRTFEHLDAVFRQLEDSARVFLAFSERIHQIHRVAEVITNLSRQTNLLALNAAIEASKAGDEGKGFAVVAGEIRKLADGAERSADQITTLLSKLDEESREVRRLMEGSGRQVAEGREGLRTASGSLEEITALVGANARQMGEILQLIQVQTEGGRKIVGFVDQIERVAEGNAAATHEISATIDSQTAAMEDMAQAAMRLSQTAEELTRRVERFRLPEGGEA
ncbi:MAG: methyl-accepting chemotaxis protein [Deltaproteobacteria bacterium]|nr:methyl-accepting chemotaxis protein [Deltaproteobacteria bacterium]